VKDLVVQERTRLQEDHSCPIPVQIVVNALLRDFVFKRLIPSLLASTDRNLEVHLLDYSATKAETSFSASSTCRVFEHARRTETAGYGENHNFLFEKRGTTSPFIILNPDTIVAKNAIDNLLLRKTLGGSQVAIVEGRQWPYEHPKEYDSVTHETPWATGAFLLLDGVFFETVRGFDERYFMYHEDVDLSWTAWHRGWKVLYEPLASCFHFSEGPYHRTDLPSLEEIQGKVNFIKLLEKFFGLSGLEYAHYVLLDMFEYEEVEFLFKKAGFKLNEQSIVSPELAFRLSACTDKTLNKKFNFLEMTRVPQIKVLGYNRFHDLRFEN